MYTKLTNQFRSKRFFVYNDPYFYFKFNTTNIMTYALLYVRDLFDIYCAAECYTVTHLSLVKSFYYYYNMFSSIV